MAATSSAPAIPGNPTMSSIVSAISALDPAHAAIAQQMIPDPNAPRAPKTLMLPTPGPVTPAIVQEGLFPDDHPGPPQIPMEQMDEWSGIVNGTQLVVGSGVVTGGPDSREPTGVGVMVANHRHRVSRPINTRASRVSSPSHQ